MTHYEVARRWASEARKPYGKGSSMFYDKDTIYSWGYHWPIAKKVTLGDTGRNVVLFHAVSHTPSTNKHTGIVRNTLYRECLVVHFVDHGFFGSVVDEASLVEAQRLSKLAAEERKAARAESRRQSATLARERAKRDAKEWLLGLIGSDDPSIVTGNAALTIHKAVNPGYRNRYYIHDTPVLQAFVAFVKGNITLLKTPGRLLKLVQSAQNLLPS